MRRIVFLVYFFMVSAEVIAGTTGKIAGKVIDSATREPLVLANVIIVGTNLGAATDTEGNYYILNLPPGKYSVQVRYIGYHAQIKTDVQVIVDKTATVNFELSSEAVEAEAITVTAYKIDRVDPDITATRHVYSKEDIENKAGVRSVRDILDLQADAVGEQIRSGRLGEVNYILDGASIIAPFSNAAAFVPLIEAMQQAEVITSGFSAEYGNAMSGVVNMVMREGGDQWNTSIDFTNDIPRDKLHANVYSIEANDHWELLNSPYAWLGTYQDRLLYATLIATETTNRPDSVNAYLAYLDYRLFFNRMGISKKTMDSRLSIATGGPISDKMRLFFAGSFLRDWNPIPYYRPLQDYQIMGNLSYQMDARNKLKLLYTKNYNNQAIRNIGWMRQSLWNTTYNLTLAEWFTDRYGLQYTHILNSSTFFNLNLSYQISKHVESLPLVERREYSSEITPPYGTFRPPSWQSGGGLQSSRAYFQRDKILSLDGNMTSQATKSNLLKAGFQFQYYDIMEDVDQNWTYEGQGTWRKYTRAPIEGAVYLQDKLEVEGIVANIGLRWDYYNYRTDYYADIYSPLRNPDYDPTLPFSEREPEYDKEKALTERSKFTSRLQPRVGVSFPISVGSVFHINYGQFFQRPGFRYIYYFFEEVNGEVIELGNPRLRPEVTTQYDFGVVNSLPLGFILDVSAYYKFVEDLVEQAIYRDAGGRQYSTFENRDYAKIRGFYINVGNQGKFFGIDLKYNWEVAKGKTSTVTESPTVYQETTGIPGSGQRFSVPDPDDILLAFDRTHKLVAHAYVATGENMWPRVFGFRPFAGIDLHCYFTLRSGQPYTDEEGLATGNIYNRRLPVSKFLRFRINKQLNIAGQNLTLYVEGFNLLNDKEYDYWNLFNSLARSQSLEGLENGTVDKFPAEYVGPYTWTDPANTYNIYGEPPRYFRAGIRFDF